MNSPESGHPETLGQRLKAQRQRLGMTQDELAEKLYIPKATISAYENDKIDIKASRLVELAKTLATTPNYLLGVEDGEAGEMDMMAQTMTVMLEKIQDEKIRNVLMAQIKVAAELVS